MYHLPTPSSMAWMDSSFSVYPFISIVGLNAMAAAFQVQMFPKYDLQRSAFLPKSIPGQFPTVASLSVCAYILCILIWGELNSFHLYLYNPSCRRLLLCPYIHLTSTLMCSSVTYSFGDARNNRALVGS